MKNNLYLYVVWFVHQHSLLALVTKVCGDRKPAHFNSIFYFSELYNSEKHIDVIQYLNNRLDIITKTSLDYTNVLKLLENYTVYDYTIIKRNLECKLLYSGGRPSTYIYCMVSKKVIEATCVRRVLVVSTRSWHQWMQHTNTIVRTPPTWNSPISLSLTSVDCFVCFHGSFTSTDIILIGIAKLSQTRWVVC